MEENQVFKFKKGDILIHKASGEKTVVLEFGEYDFSSPINNPVLEKKYKLEFSSEKRTYIDKERVEACYELVK